jgi:hypothetical protein
MVVPPKKATQANAATNLSLGFEAIEITLSRKNQYNHLKICNSRLFGCLRVLLASS